MDQLSSDMFQSLLSWISDSNAYEKDENGSYRCFNPCYRGLVIRTEEQNDGKIKMERFNPCYRGLVIRTARFQ